MKTCDRDGCDNEFKPLSAKHRYCSARCRQYVNNHKPENLAAKRANSIRWRQNNPGRWRAYVNGYARARRRNAKLLAAAKIEKMVEPIVRGLPLRILILLSDAPPDGPLYMRLLIEATGEKAVEITPAVDCLVRMGWVEDEREDVPPEESGRMPRRYLRITTAGRVRLNEARLSDV